MNLGGGKGMMKGGGCVWEGEWGDGGVAGSERGGRWGERRGRRGSGTLEFEFEEIRVGEVGGGSLRLVWGAGTGEVAVGRGFWGGGVVGGVGGPGREGARGRSGRRFVRACVCKAYGRWSFVQCCCMEEGVI